MHRVFIATVFCCELEVTLEHQVHYLLDEVKVSNSSKLFRIYNNIFNTPKSVSGMNFDFCVILCKLCFLYIWIFLMSYDNI